jgi:hypothetical protein
MPVVLSNDSYISNNFQNNTQKTTLNSFNKTMKSFNNPSKNIHSNKKIKQQKIKQQAIFDAFQKQKNDIILNAKNNSIDFSKYTAEKSELDEEPSASNNYGYLKLPPLTLDDTNKLKTSTNQKGGTLNPLNGLTPFYPVSDSGQTLESSQLLELLYDLEKNLPNNVKSFIFFESCDSTTQQSFMISNLYYQFAVVLYSDIIIDFSKEYYKIDLNPDKTFDFNAKHDKSILVENIIPTSTTYSVVVSDTNNVKYNVEINYHVNQFGVKLKDFSHENVTFLFCSRDKNGSYIVPASKILNQTELSELFTKTPTNFEFKITDVNIYDLRQVVCYTHSWDFYMNDALWNNFANINIQTAIDKLQMLEIGLDKSEFDLTKYPPGSNEYSLNLNDIESNSKFSFTDNNGTIIPFGFNFDKNEYLSEINNSNKVIEFLKKEAIFKNELYNSIMKLKRNVSDYSGIRFEEYGYLNNYHNVVYRGMTRKFDLSLSDVIPGGGFVSKGFLSTSIDINVAEGFAKNNGFIYKFTVMPGVPYISYDFEPFESIYGVDEKEVLICNNAIINVETAHYTMYNNIPVIRGTISYDVNDVISKQHRHSVLTKLHSIKNDYFVDDMYANDNPCKWSIVPVSNGGKKKLTKRRKCKTRRYKRKYKK